MYLKIYLEASGIHILSIDLLEVILGYRRQTKDISIRDLADYPIIKDYNSRCFTKR